MIHRVAPWLRALLLRRRQEREMQEEMAEHLARSMERLLARGLSPEEARREAQREFGNLTYLQEEARLARGTGWLDALAADTRFALRQFRRRWATSLTMFAILTAGMVISTLLLSYVHWYAAAPPPAMERAADLVRIRGSQDTGVDGVGIRGFAREEAEEYLRLGQHFRAATAWAEATVSVDAGAGEGAHGVLAEATFVMGDYFGVLGVRPQLGPGLPTGEAEAPVAVISHTAWERLYGRSPAAVGSVLMINGTPVTVMGVAPRRFLGIGGGTSVQLWLPHSARHALLPAPSVETLVYWAAARLQPGASAAAATAASRVVLARAATANPALAARQADVAVVPLTGTSGDPMKERDVRTLSVLLGGLGLLVLGVACTNVGALQTGLALARRREVAVRLSLGASRRRLIRQLLTESALLSLAAGAAALGAVQAFFAIIEAIFPLVPMHLALSWPLVLATFGTALGVGMVFGLSPALHATRVALAGALQDSAAAIASNRLRLQRLLVVAQIALSQPLVVLLAAGLLVAIGQLQPGEGLADADRLVKLRLRPATGNPWAVGQGERQPGEGEAELRALLAALKGVPGVAAAVPDAQPRGALGRYAVLPTDRVAGGAEEALQLTAQEAAPGYFRVAAIPLLRGRDFTPADAHLLAGADEAPVVIGSDLARQLFPGADPVGRRLRTPGDSAAAGAPTLVVAGVVADPEHRSGAHSVYLPLPADAPPATLLLRTVGPAEPLLPALRAAAMEALPHRVATARTVAHVEQDAARTFRRVTGALAGAGALMLLLSALGLYAVVAFAVGQRTGEIAVRMAVGAPPRRIARRFVGDGLRLSAAGVALGLPVALLGLRGYNALTGLDADFPAVAIPPVALAAALAAVLVTLAAAAIPARRAARVSPAVALRRG